MKKLILIAAILIPIGLWAYRKGKAGLNLTYEVVRIDLKQFNWNDFRMIVTTNVINNSNQNLLLNSIVGNVLIQGNFTGSINQTWNTTITPGSNQLRIEIVFNLIASLRNLWQSYKGKKINVSFVGDLKFENVTLPVKYEYAFGG